MSIDIRTFFVVIAVISLAIASVMALSGRRYRNIPGLDLWSAGTFALGAGLTAFFVRLIAPLWLSVVIANTLIVLHPILVWNGSRVYNGHPALWKFPLAAVVLIVVALIVFTYVDDDIAVRTAVVSLFMVLGYIACTVELLARTMPPAHRTARVAAGATLFIAVALSVRFFIAFTLSPDWNPSYYVMSGSETARAMVTTAAVIVLSVCLLLMAMQRLQQRIEERNAELEALAEERDQARDRAEQANLAKSNFLAMMSHELRTPLNAILGFSEVIRDTRMEPVGPLYRGYADDIHQAGQHLLDLVNNVLDLSKIEAGRLELYEETVNLRAVISACTQLIGTTAEDSAIAVETSLPDDLPAFRGDGLRLKQIVLNLLSNAVKFTPSGGIVRIAVSLPAAGGLELSIADTGIGMRKEDIAIAVAPFMQLESPLNREHGGTGLGLPLTKSLAELHGGTLEVESEPKRGTTVRIRFPDYRVVRDAAS